jgi:hypothetical protein
MPGAKGKPRLIIVGGLQDHPAGRAALIEAFAAC